MMIHSFPAPYFDEIWVSNVSRYGDRHSLSSHKIINQMGLKLNDRYPLLPLKLNNFTDKIAPHLFKGVDDLILNHTLFRYFAFGFNFSDRKKLFEAMKGCGTQEYKSPGVIFYFKHQPSIMFCPLCVCDDRQRFGETYFHRSHQLGLFVCPVHNIELQNSRIKTRNLTKFVSAENADLGLVNLKVNQYNSRAHQILFSMSKEAFLLLNSNCRMMSLGDVAEVYRKELVDQGYVNNNKMRWYYEKLHSEFEKFYTSKFLEKLNCSFTKTKKNSWLIRMFRDVRRQDTVRHLLLMHFLGLKVQNFLIDSDIPR